MKIHTVALSALLIAASSSAFAEDPAKLAQQKGCLACHQIDKKAIGPSYKEVANKYAGKPDATEKLAKSIQNGSAGVWGAMPMPKNNVTAAEATTLATWVLSQKQ